jgi:protein-disulfide isomerase
MSLRFLTPALMALFLGAAGFTLAGAALAESHATSTEAMTENASESAGDTATADAATEEDGEVREMTLGEDDAPVEIIEYASFTCPHCASFHENAFGKLKKNYIDTGKVKFVLREVYFDRYGLWAGMVARCSGPDRYFGIVDILYERQKEWAKGDPAEIADNLRRIGRSSGMSEEQLEACLTDGEKAQAMVAVYQENAERDGINSTPSFMIDGELKSNMSYDELKTLLDEKLESQ